MTGRACPVCTSDASTLLARLDYALPEGSSLPKQTSLELCARCGFAYVTAEATEDSYLRHYSQDSLYADVNRVGSGTQEYDRTRLERVAARLKPWLQRGDLLIDIGASTGGMLSVSTELLGLDAIGIDPDQRCVDLMLAQGQRARRGSFAELPSDLLGSAQAICLNHVLEHLWNPIRDLRRAVELLDQHGILYIETPDAAGYSDHPNAWRYYLDSEHINHFTRQDFYSLANQIDCNLIDSGNALLTLEDGTPYPVTWAILKRGRHPEAGGVAHARPHPIERYLEQQQTILEAWRDALTTVRERVDGPWLIWGTGSHAQRVLGAGLIDASGVAAFIDSDPGKQGKRLLGRSILEPKAAFAAFPDAHIAVLAARAASFSIAKSLAAYGREHSAVFLT